jgi:hypothetical protein
LRLDGKVPALPKRTGYQTVKYFVPTPVVPFNLAKGPSGPALSSPVLCGACEGHNFTEQVNKTFQFILREKFKNETRSLIFIAVA